MGSSLRSAQTRSAPIKDLILFGVQKTHQIEPCLDVEAKKVDAFWMPKSRGWWSVTLQRLSTEFFGLGFRLKLPTS